MKVLQLGKYYPPHFGGIETVTFDLCEGLNEKGIQTDVLCSNIDNTYEELVYKSHTIYRTKSLGIFASTPISFQIITKLKKIADEYDIIHVHLPNPMTTLAIFLVRPKAKIVLHWHSDIVKQKYILKIFNPLQNWLLKRADKIIATSPKYIEGSIPLKRYITKVESIPLGIDPNKIVSSDEKVKSILKKYKNKKIIFSLGRLEYYKGFEYLIKAAQYLDDSYIILIGGTGSLYDELKKIIIEHDLENKVTLLGRVSEDELGNYFQASDIFCLPSVAKSEAFGVVQLEAMCFNKPLIATKIVGSGVDWVNQDGVTGINVPIKNPHAIAEAIIKILSNKEIYMKYSNNSGKRFNELFTKKHMIDNFIQLYKKLLSPRGY